MDIVLDRIEVYSEEVLEPAIGIGGRDIGKEIMEQLGRSRSLITVLLMYANRPVQTVKRSERQNPEVCINTSIPQPMDGIKYDWRTVRKAGYQERWRFL